jgi:hypothetical protein
MLQNGIIPQMKPWTQASRDYAAGRGAQFSPGAGLERGLYVGASKTTSGFGPVTLAIRVPRAWLEVPAELLHLGSERGSDAVDAALESEHGAVITHAVHPSAIREV